MGKALQFRSAEMEPGSWLHRNAFMRLLYERLDAAAAAQGGHLTVRTDTACVGLAPPVVVTDDDGVLVGGGDADPRALLTLRNKQTGEEEVVRPDLVIGADGVRSVVRNALGGALGYGDPADFTRHYPSPAAKVAYRTLALLPCPPLTADGSLTAKPHMTYVCRGKAFNLGMLCVGSDPALPRIGTVTRLATDPIWQHRTVDEYWAAFEDNFPHLPLRRMVAPGAMEAFAAGSIVSFPTPTMPEALGGGLAPRGWRSSATLLTPSRRTSGRASMRRLRMWAPSSTCSPNMQLPPAAAATVGAAAAAPHRPNGWTQPPLPPPTTPPAGTTWPPSSA
eukprot:TRINITY_DN4605_c0_g1_i1.p2 TRINITY_DN4605_c0_g1~~TRINITY_DN4605_c0_g1_i1.p2  ORF type:complete len:335 (-),score=97.01 TRINITY_DN4605_c0_g1_i1:438-1442(-)